MAAEVIKVYQEHLPALRLIGKRYTDQDRDAAGSLGEKWGNGSRAVGSMSLLTLVPCRSRKGLLTE